MIYSRILGTGSYLPPKTLTNLDLEKIVETSDEWITERTGIKSRHIIEEGQNNLHMAEKAAQNAIEAAGIEKEKIDLIIFATCTPDNLFPSMAIQLQMAMGINETLCPSFDIGAACGGFIYALTIADQFVKNGAAEHVLVVCSEALTRVANWQDRSTCILFGDGAGAAVVGQSEEPGIYGSVLHANGQYKDLLYLSGDIYDKNAAPSCVSMKGNEVFKVAVTKLDSIVDEVLEKNNLHKEDIDWLVPHQANLRIIQAAAKRLNMPMEQVILTVQDQGNTSAASVPLALDIGIRDGRIKPGDTLLLEAFGAGFVWGAVVVRL